MRAAVCFSSRSCACQVRRAMDYFTQSGKPLWGFTESSVDMTLLCLMGGCTRVRLGFLLWNYFVSSFEKQTLPSHEERLLGQHTGLLTQHLEDVLCLLALCNFDGVREKGRGCAWKYGWTDDGAFRGQFSLFLRRTSFSDPCSEQSLGHCKGGDWCTCPMLRYASHISDTFPINVSLSSRGRGKESGKHQRNHMSNAPTLLYVPPTITYKT